MRSASRLLPRVTVLVAVAVAAHLLMPLQPGTPAAAQPLDAVASVGGAHGAHQPVAAVAAAAVIASADRTTQPHGEHAAHGHLMLALCLAVLAAVAGLVLARSDRPLRPLITPSLLAQRAPPARLWVPPPLPPGRVDAGIVLRV